MDAHLSFIQANTRKASEVVVTIVPTQTRICWPDWGIQLEETYPMVIVIHGAVFR